MMRTQIARILAASTRSAGSRTAFKSSLPQKALIGLLGSGNTQSKGVFSFQHIRPGQLRFYASGPPPLTRELVEQRIVALLQAYDKVTDPSKVASQATFSEDLGLDSLDIVEVVLGIEEEFNVEIPDHIADEIKSVSQAVDYIIEQPDGE